MPSISPRALALSCTLCSLLACSDPPTAVVEDAAARADAAANDAGPGRDAAPEADAALEADAETADVALPDAAPGADASPADTGVSPPLGEGDIGPAGGVVRAGPVTITFPPGAVTSTLRVTVRETSSRTADGLAVLASYVFEPDGASFAEPVAVSVAVDPARVPAGPYTVGEGLVLLHDHRGEVDVAAVAAPSATALAGSVRSFSTFDVVFTRGDPRCQVRVTTSGGQGSENVNVDRIGATGDPDYGVRCVGARCRCRTNDPVLSLTKGGVTFTIPDGFPRDVDSAATFARASYAASSLCSFPCASPGAGCSSVSVRAAPVPHAIDRARNRPSLPGGQLRDGVYAVVGSTTYADQIQDDESTRRVRATVELSGTAPSGAGQRVLLDRREARDGSPLWSTYEYGYSLSLATSGPLDTELRPSGMTCPTSWPSAQTIEYAVRDGGLTLAWPVFDVLAGPTVRVETLEEICDNVTLDPAPTPITEMFVGGAPPAAVGAAPSGGALPETELVLESVSSYGAQPPTATDESSTALRITSLGGGRYLLERREAPPVLDGVVGRSRLVVEIMGTELVPAPGEPQCGRSAGRNLRFSTSADGARLSLFTTTSAGNAAVETYRRRDLAPTLMCNSLDMEAPSVTPTVTTLGAPYPAGTWTGFPSGQSWVDFVGAYDLVGVDAIMPPAGPRRARIRVLGPVSSGPCAGFEARVDVREDTAAGPAEWVRCVSFTQPATGGRDASYSFNTSSAGPDCRSDQGSYRFTASGAGAARTIAWGSSGTRDTYRWVGP